MSETETTISKLVAFASDPDVKAIVMCQAVPGATPGIQKIREMGRDDILFIAGTPQEDPAVISEAADIIMYANEPARATPSWKSAPSGHRRVHALFLPAPHGHGDHRGPLQHPQGQRRGSGH